MANCKYKLKLGDQVFEFSSDEELNSFLNNNQNRLEVFKLVDAKDTTPATSITPNDRVVFGHPTIGKSFLKKAGDDRFISLDDDYGREVDAKVTEIATKYKVSKYQVKDGGDKIWNSEYNTKMQELYDEAKAKALKEGKTLFTSNTRLLQNNLVDFDKVVNIPTDVFIKRVKETRPDATYNTTDWKNQINAVISQVSPSKVITTSGYLADILDFPNPSKDEFYQITSEEARPADKKLDDHLIALMKPFNVQVHEYRDLKSKIGMDALGMTDTLNKLIYLASNRNVDTVPEEVAHMAVMLMGKDHKDVKALLDTITVWDKYEDIKKQYLPIYKNLDQVKIEAIGKLIAEATVKNWDQSNKGQVGLLQKALDVITNFFGVISNFFGMDTGYGYASEIANKIAINMLLGDVNYIANNTPDHAPLNYKEAVNNNPLAKNVIDTFTETFGFKLVGSLAIAGQGQVIHRNSKDPIHDLDFRVPYDADKSALQATLDEMGAVRIHYGWKSDHYMTNAYYIPAPGLRIIEGKRSERNFLKPENIHLVDKDGNKVESNAKTVMAVDLFEYFEENDEFNIYGKFSSWQDIFRGKLRLSPKRSKERMFQREKDQADYVYANPTERSIQIPDFVYYQLNPPKFSKEFNHKEETIAKFHKAQIESNGLTIEIDKDGNKVERHLNSAYTGVTGAIRKIRRGGKLIIKSYDEANLRQNRKQLDSVKFASLPEYQGMNKEQIEKVIDSQIDNDISKWKMLAVMGTDIHAIAEQYFKYGITDPTEMIQKIEKPFTIGTMGKYLDILAQIHDSIKADTGDPNVKILTEVKIHDTSSKIGGIIDLVAVDKDGNAHLYDYKTSHKKFEEWDKTKLRTMEYQMAFYTQLLATKGITVTNVNIIPLELEDIDYTNNLVSDITRRSIMELNTTLFNTEGTAYIMRDARSAIPTSLTSLMEKQVQSENIKKELKGALDYNVAMRRTASSVEEFMTSFIKYETDGTGRKFFLRGADRVHLTGDEAKDKALIEAHLAEMSETEKNIIPEHKKYIKDVIARVPDRNIATRYQGNGNERRNKTFQTMFTRYSDGMWEVIDSADLDNLGILAFRNIATNTLEFVSITGNALNSRVKLSKGTTILGNYVDDRTALAGNDDKLLDSSNANIEFIKVAMWLNDNVKKLSGGSNTDLNIGYIRAVNFGTGDIEGADINKLLHTYSRLCKYTKASDNIKKIKFMNHYELMLAKIDMLLNDSPDVSPKLRDKLGALKTGIDMDTTAAKIQALLLWQKEWADLNGIDVRNMELTQDSIPSSIYVMINAAMLDLINMSPSWEQDLKKMSLNNSTLFTSPNSMDSHTMQLTNNLAKNAIQKIRINHTNFKEESRDKYEELFENAGLSKFRRYTIGDNIKAYDALLVKDPKTGKVASDLLLLDPYNPNSKLDPKQREFLKYYLDAINSFRYPNKDNVSIMELKASGDWFKLPLVRASSTSRLKGKDYKSVVTDGYKTMLDFVNMFTDEHAENIEASQAMLDMYNQFANDGNEAGRIKREKYLADHPTSEFELDLEVVLDTFAMAHFRKQEYDKVLPFIHAVRVVTQWNHTGYLNKDMPNLVEHLKNTTKTAIFNEHIIEPHLEPFVKVGLATKTVITKLNLGVSMITLGKEMLQGQFGNLAAKYSKLYGEDSFDPKDYNKAFKMMVQNSPNFINTVEVVEELNHIYGMAGMDVNAIDKKMLMTKTGVMAFENRFLMWASSAPDYFHRMTLLVAQMLKDGSYYAHTMVKGKLVYDWTKDERYSVYAAGKTNDPKYQYQRALYFAVLDQFNSENIGGLDGEFLKEGDPIPRAYTTKQKESLKSFADSIHGALDHENRDGFSRTFFGMMVIHFNSWLNAKKDKFFLKPAIYNRGYFVHVKDDDGNLLYRQVDENGNRTTEVSTVVTEWPHVAWKGKWQEGILYSLRGMMKEAWDTRMDLEKMRKYSQDNPVALANVKMLAHDFAFYTMLLVLAGLIDFEELKADSPYTAAVGRSLLNSGNDLNPINNLMAVINPKSMIPSVGYITQVATDFSSVITGDMSVPNMLTRDIGALRQFKHMVNTNPESD